MKYITSKGIIIYKDSIRFLIFVSQYKQILSNKLLFAFWTFFWLKIIFVLYSTIKIKKIDSSYKLFTFLMKIIL
jgi:hypothetical protein